MAAGMPSEMQTPLIAVRKTQTLQRLRESPPQLIRRGEERRVFAQTTRAVCVTPSDEKKKVMAASSSTSAEMEASPMMSMFHW